MLYEKILEARSLSKSYNGQHLIETSVEDIIHSLIDNFVLAKAGARLLTGLEGNVKISRIKNGSEVDWKIENALSNETDLVFDGFTLTPHRLTCYIDISDQLLIQSSQNVIDFLLYEIGRKMAVKLQTAILSNTQVSNAPRKIYTKGIQTEVYDEMSYEKILECVEKIDLEGLTGDICCIGNIDMKKSLRQTFIPSSGLAILNSGKIDNYEFYTCTDSGALYIGDFSQVVIGMWDKANVYVDTLSQKDKGVTRITVSAYFDYGLMHPTQIAALYTQAEKDEASSGEEVEPTPPTPEEEIVDTTNWSDMVGKSKRDEGLNGYITFGQASDIDLNREIPSNQLGFYSASQTLKERYSDYDWICFQADCYKYDFTTGNYSTQIMDDGNTETETPGVAGGYKYRIIPIEDQEEQAWWQSLIQSVEVKIDDEWQEVEWDSIVQADAYLYRKGAWWSPNYSILKSAAAVNLIAYANSGVLFDSSGKRLFTDLRILVSNMDGSYKYLYGTDIMTLNNGLNVNKAIEGDVDIDWDSYDAGWDVADTITYYDVNGDVIEIE